MDLPRFSVVLNEVDREMVLARIAAEGTGVTPTQWLYTAIHVNMREPSPGAGGKIMTNTEWMGRMRVPSPRWEVSFGGVIPQWRDAVKMRAKSMGFTLASYLRFLIQHGA